MNALLDETKNARIEFGLPWLHELKVSPTIKQILLEEKPSNLGWGDFAIFSMLTFAFIARMMRFDLRGVIRLGVRVVGALPDEPPALPTSVGSPDEPPARPLAKAPAR
jgi:hypothetical protein